MNFKLSEKLNKHIILFAVYSFFCGFIGIGINNAVKQGAMQTSLIRIPYISLNSLVVFLSVFITVFALLIIFCELTAKTENITKYFDRIITHPLLFIMLAVACFRLWYYSNFDLSTVWYDTSTYVEYNHNIFLGQVDKFRTPIYPWFIRIISLLSFSEPNGVSFYDSIALMQKMVSYTGTAIIYFAAQKMYKNKIVIAVVTFIYGISPAIISWDMSILTESLSLFTVSVLIYLIASYLEVPTNVKAVVLGLFSFVMIMLRPTFVYMLAILFVFFIARLIFSKFDRKQSVYGLVSVLLSLCLMIGYCSLNFINNNCFALSSVSTTVNNLYTVIEQDWCHNDDYPEITKYIDNKIMSSDEYDINYITDVVEPANEEFSYSELSAYVNDCISDNKEDFTSYTIDKFASVMNQEIAVQYASIIRLHSADYLTMDSVLVNLSFPFTIAMCFVLVIISVIFAIYQLIRNRVIIWHIIGLSAIIFSHIFVSVYGAMAEFDRLSVMVIPCVYMLLFMFVDFAVYRPKKNSFKNELVLRFGQVFVREKSENELQNALTEVNDDNQLASESKNDSEDIVL